MSYCLNPDCQKPHNPSDAKFCLRCGTKLLLGDCYRSLEIISRGQFGRTILGVDECNPSKPRCIIKQLFPRTQKTIIPEEAAQLFQQKVDRLEELGTHPQIPALLAHFTQNQYHYLVQECIDGQNLAQDLEAHGAFNEFQIRQFLAEILPVLQFVHERNVIHRDIKPQNIIRRTISTTRLTTEGTLPAQGGNGGTTGSQLFLVDFGTAKITRESAMPSMGTMLGTSSGYAAPEQALGKVTFTSDLYSLGVICIHLLTGIDPFELYSVSEGDWIWRDHLSNPVTLQLGQMLDKLLEHATKRRYQNAAEVLHDLNLIETAAQAATIRIPLQKPDIQPPPQVPEMVTEATPTPLQVPEIAKSTVPTPLQVPEVVRAAAPTPQIQTWKCVQTLVGQSEKRSDWYAGITSIAFSPDDQWIAGGSEDSTIRVWELGTGKEFHTLTGHSEFIRSIAISPDGTLLASASGEIIKLWELSTGQEIRTLSGHSELIQRITFSPDGQMLASGGNDKTIKLWNPETGEEIRTLSGTNLIDAVSFSPDGQMLVSCDRDHKIKLWNLETGEEIRTFSGHSHTIRAVTFSPDGNTLASGSCDKTIKIWNLETGALVHTLTGHSGWFAAVNSVAFTPDGQILVSGSDDKTIKLWNPETGKTIVTLSGHSKGVSSVVFSPDGHSLASGSFDKTIKIWQLA